MNTIELPDSLSEKFGKTFNAGELIFCEWEPGNNFYFIQKGQVKIVKIVKDVEKTMDILEDGDIFGEMAILEEQPRSASAIAVNQVDVLDFNSENFTTLMSSQPQLALKLLYIFAKRIYDAKRRAMILLLEDEQTRVADVFLMLAEKEKNFASLKEIHFNAGVEDIANWCSLPLDSVQPIIKHWIRGGKIELRGDNISVLNMGEFKRLVATKRKPIK